MQPTIVYQGQPTSSYLARIVLVQDEEDPCRTIIVVEYLSGTDALGGQRWLDVTYPDNGSDKIRRDAILEGAVRKLHECVDTLIMTAETQRKIMLDKLKSPEFRERLVAHFSESRKRHTDHNEPSNVLDYIVECLQQGGEKHA